MYRKYILALLIFLSCSLSSSEEHAFQGKHFMASYLECDPSALEDLDALRFVMTAAVEASNANILAINSHEFTGGGITIVYLLSESHASIHTYPEEGSCFVDLFTCGDDCSYTPFDEILRWYLKPKKAPTLLLLRDEDFVELVPDLEDVSPCDLQ